MIQVEGAATLRTRLERTPDGVRATVRTGLRAAGVVVMDRARANAAWSSRIPAAMSLRTSITASGSSVSVVVSGARAPHARPYEGFSGRAFRHPLFGDRGHWYTQSARPFLRPAAESTTARVEAIVAAAVDKAIAAGGA